MEHATASQPGRAATGLGTGSRTMADLLPLAAQRYGSTPAVKLKEDSGRWATRSFAEVGERVQSLALGLVDLGIKRGEMVSILANTRPEWTYVDFAALSIGATVVPIYQTNSPDECRYVLENSDAAAVVVEDANQLAKIQQVREHLPKLRHVIIMSGSGEGAITLDEVAERGAARSASEWEELWSSVDPDDICTIIYTSGTTGPPKGCVISHANYRAMVDMSLSEGVVQGGKTTYLFLPLAHSFALLIQLATVDIGGCIAYWERDPDKIVPNLSEVKPEYFPSVPRIFEKIYTTATTGVEEAGGIKKRLFDWAIGVGKRMREAEAQPGGPGALLRAQYAVADRLVLHKIRELFGGNVEQAITGAAPINPDILRFFHAAGLLILEGWGMTETSTAACVATPYDFKFGTVGKPFPGVEVRIAEDGEVLVRGPNVFQGYYKNPEATAETIIDGWLHTGDIGEVDGDGFVKITGRKKDIIITAGGKNITPSNIEAEIKQSRWVSQCVVVGDERPYLVALVTLDAEEVAKFASERGLPPDPEALASNPDLRSEIESHVDEINNLFARAEQVKKIDILPHDLTQEAGELTPTLKVKRAVVLDKYSDRLEALYAD